MERSAPVLVLMLLTASLAPVLAVSEAVLTVSWSEGGTVSVSGPIVQEGPGVFRTGVGAEVTLFAVAQERYAFDRWLSDNPSINGSASNPLTFRVNSSMRVTAVFRPLFERVEFVRISVSSPVPISYPEIVLKGRRVVISAPEVYVLRDREDLRYVFSAWILNGTTIRSATVSFVATANVNLTAVYRKEFRFMGEWFRIEEGAALQRFEVELAPGVMGRVSCYRNLKLNVTLCVNKSEVYVPKDMLPDFQPIYEKLYRVTISVVGVPQAEVFVNDEYHLVAPSKTVLVKEGSEITVAALPRVGDYVIQDESVRTLKVVGPVTVTFVYELDPLSRFHPFLRQVGALLLATPLRDAVLSMPDPLPNLLALSPVAAVVAGLAVPVRYLARRLRRERLEEVLSVDEAIAFESPRQVGYAQSVERTVGIGGGLGDPELEELMRQARRRTRAPVTAQAKRDERPIPIDEVLKRGREGAAIDYRELVSVLLKGSLGEEDLVRLVSLRAVVVGDPEPLPLNLPEEDVIALVGGDGRSYSLRSAGIRVVPSWSIRPEDLKELVPAERKKVRPVIALSWCDVLEPHEVLSYSARAAAEGVRLVMLFDGPNAAPPVPSVRLDPPPAELLRAVVMAEGLRAGRVVGLREAEVAAELASKLPGLQLAMARAFGLSPSNPLEALQAEKLGLALHTVRQLAASGVEVGRRELEGWVVDSLRAYGGVRMLKYREKVVNRLWEIIEVVEEWRSRSW